MTHKKYEVLGRCIEGNQTKKYEVRGRCMESNQTENSVLKICFLFSCLITIYSRESPPRKHSFNKAKQCSKRG